MSCRAAQQERDDNPEQGIWYYRSHGSVPRQRVPAVDYFCGDVFITGWLLYAVREVCFVQFRTMDMPQYSGYSNYQVFCIFREHLRAPAERLPDAKRLGPGVQIEPAVLPNVSHHQEKGQREFSALPRVAAPLPERVRVENAQIPQNQCPQRSAGCACSKRKRRGCSSRVNFLFGDVLAKSQLKRPPWHRQDLPLVSRGVV